MDWNLLPVFALGWCGAAAVNYLADVLPRRRKLVTPFCLACEADQPRLAYWLWPGSCRHCNSRRGWRTWLIYLAGLSAAAFLWLKADMRLPFWLSLIIWLYFGLVIVIDVEHRLILHLTSYFGALLGLVVGSLLHGIVPTLIGGAAGFGFMLFMYWLGSVFVRMVDKRRHAKNLQPAEAQGEPLSSPPQVQGGEEPIEDALGFGDVNLAGIVGLFLGWPGVTAGLLLTILLGGVVSLLYLLISLLLRRYRAFAAIPYGPFLAVAVLFLLYFS